jgi:anthranilate phosphoribosyltransferase
MQGELAFLITLSKSGNGVYCKVRSSDRLSAASPAKYATVIEDELLGEEAGEENSVAAMAGGALYAAISGLVIKRLYNG